MTWADEAIELADRITEHGPYPAGVDTHGLTVPGILVHPAPSLDLATGTLEGSVGVVWEVACLVPQPGDLAGCRMLGEMVDQVVDALDQLLAPLDAQPRQYALSPSTVLPAYVCRLEEIR